MILRLRFLPVFFLSILTALTGLQAQNLIPNGNFQSTISADNLWDGVDGDGYLCGRVRTVTALNSRDTVSEVAQPVSVAVGDLNGDGLPDLLMADPLGYFRIYFNSGTKTAPKFTHCELVPIYLSRCVPPPGTPRTAYLGAWPDLIYSTPKIDLYPLSGRGMLDLMVGTYGGDLLVIPNAGGKAGPVYRQPQTVESAIIPTSSKGQRWANLLAPAVIDWNKDTRPDVLVGDGSYSANSVFLLLNPGQAGGVRFTEDTRTYLVYGNGRTQLCPTLADYNGDGLPDVIVSDSAGQVTVNLNDGKWKPGRVLDQSSVISFGGAQSLNTAVTVKAADLNGDGLFDLVFGKTNGRIAIAYNKGTKEQPQFGVPEEIKGEDVWKRDLKVPVSWTFDTGEHKGNFLANASVVSAADDPAAQAPDGKNCLKLFYNQPLNRVIPLTVLKTLPANPKSDFIFDSSHGMHSVSAPLVGADAPVSSFICQVTVPKLEANQPYEFSFKVKGSNFDAAYLIGLSADAQIAPTKIVRGERGSAVFDSNSMRDTDTKNGTFGSSNSWTTVSKTVSFRFGHHPELNDPKKWKGSGKIGYTGTLVLRVDLSPFNGVCYIDDVQLVKK